MNKRCFESFDMVKYIGVFILLGRDEKCMSMMMREKMKK